MRAMERSSGSAYYWLATRFDGIRMEILTLDDAGGTLLPVFGSREAARGFLLSGRGRERWRARPTGTGELVSMLVGARPEVKRVVLDPSPGTLEDGKVDPAGQSRKDFIDALLDANGIRSESRTPQRATSRT